MAEFAADFALGEDVLPEISKFLVVEYTGTIAIGDFLEVNGVDTTDNVLKVDKQAGTDDCIGVAMFAGVSGDRQPCLHYGVTKVTFGAAVTVGQKLSVSGNKAIDQAAAGNGLANGIIISNGAANLDTGLILFDGSGNG